jgi:hypothetical protein
MVDFPQESTRLADAFRIVGIERIDDDGRVAGGESFRGAGSL